MISGLTVAGPSSKVAWTPQTIAQIAKGDPQKGQRLAQTCASCHGAAGVSPSPIYPHTAGQNAQYTYKQLRDYKEGTRSNAIMSPMVSTLGEQGMADIAAFYAAQERPAPADQPGSAELASQLAKEGDGARLIPACSACHGRNGEGNPRSKGMPALAGQTAGYLKQTMLDYRSGARGNDVYKVMRSITENLTDQEIAALADYYASQ